MHQDVTYCIPLSSCKKSIYRWFKLQVWKTFIRTITYSKIQWIERSGVVDHCFWCPGSCKPHFETTLIRECRETHTYKSTVKKSWEMKGLGQHKVSLKSLKICTIWNKTFLNRAGDRKTNDKSATQKGCSWKERLGLNNNVWSWGHHMMHPQFKTIWETIREYLYIFHNYWPEDGSRTPET